MHLLSKWIYLNLNFALIDEILLRFIWTIIQIAL